MMTFPSSHFEDMPYRERFAAEIEARDSTHQKALDIPGPDSVHFSDTSLLSAIWPLTGKQRYEGGVRF